MDDTMASSHPSRHVDEDVLTLAQASKVMHLGIEAMRELVSTGDIDALSCNQKHTVLLREVVIDYIRKQGQKQAQERREGKIKQDHRQHANTIQRQSKRSVPPDLTRYEITADAPADPTRELRRKTF